MDNVNKNAVRDYAVVLSGVQSNACAPLHFVNASLPYF